MNKEEKDTLIAGYWFKFATLFSNITKDNLQELVDKGLTAKEIYETLNISDSVFYFLLKR